MNLPFIYNRLAELDSERLTYEQLHANLPHINPDIITLLGSLLLLNRNQWTFDGIRAELETALLELEATTV